METLVMTKQQFHEGRDVEVAYDMTSLQERHWRKAKIVRPWPSYSGLRQFYLVQFPDGSRGVFDAAHIRAKIGRNEYERGELMTPRTSIARLADDAPVPHPDSWVEHPRKGPGYVCRKPPFVASLDCPDCGATKAETSVLGFWCEHDRCPIFAKRSASAKAHQSERHE
jgi:hypothetical protein